MNKSTKVVHSYQELIDLLITIPNSSEIRYKTLSDGFQVTWSV